MVIIRFHPGTQDVKRVCAACNETRTADMPCCGTCGVAEFYWPGDKITLTIPGDAVAQPRQRHRIAGSNGRQFVQNYTSKSDPVQAFKAALRIAAGEAWGGPPMDCPVHLTLWMVFARPKSRRRKRTPQPPAIKTTKPDLDNLEKSVKDALTGVLWLDDKQVGFVQKVKLEDNAQPFTRIVVRPVRNLPPVK